MHWLLGPLRCQGCMPHSGFWSGVQQACDMASTLSSSRQSMLAGNDVAAQAQCLLELSEVLAQNIGSSAQVVSDVCKVRHVALITSRKTETLTCFQSNFRYRYLDFRRCSSHDVAVRVKVVAFDERNLSRTDLSSCVTVRNYLAIIQIRIVVKSTRHAEARARPWHFVNTSTFLWPRTFAPHFCKLCSPDFC